MTGGCSDFSGKFVPERDIFKIRWRMCSSRPPSASAGDRDDFIKEALDPALRDRVDGIITRGLSEIRSVFAADVAEYEWCAADVATIELTWNSVKDSWPPPKTS